VEKLKAQKMVVQKLKILNKIDISLQIIDLITSWHLGGDGKSRFKEIPSTVVCVKDEFVLDFDCFL